MGAGEGREKSGEGVSFDCSTIFISLGLPFKSVLVTQSCPTLGNPMDYSPLGYSIHGIFQARILEWVAISFSKGSSQPRDGTPVSRRAGILLTI